MFAETLVAEQNHPTNLEGWHLVEDLFPCPWNQPLDFFSEGGKNGGLLGWVALDKGCDFLHVFPVFAKGSLGMDKEVKDEADFPLDKWS